MLVERLENDPDLRQRLEGALLEIQVDSTLENTMEKSVNKNLFTIASHEDNDVERARKIVKWVSTEDDETVAKLIDYVFRTKPRNAVVKAAYVELIHLETLEPILLDPAARDAIDAVAALWMEKAASIALEGASKASVGVAVGVARRLAPLSEKVDAGAIRNDLLNFVKSLERALETRPKGKAVARRLHSWIDGVVTDLARGDAAVSERYQAGLAQAHALVDAPASVVRVLVSVARIQTDDPDPARRSRLEARFRLYGARDEVGLLGNTPRALNSLDDLGRQLEECREELATRHSLRMNSVRLEFLVSRELLNEPFDQWDDRKCLSAVLGNEHPVVLRSLDRLWKMRFRPQHNRFLDVLDREGDPFRVILDPEAAPPSEPTAHEACWIAPGDQKFPTTVQYLRDRPGCCMCLLAEPPAAAEPSRELDALEMLIQAGIPLALWVRTPPPAEQRDKLQEVLANLVMGKPAADVIKQVYLARLSARRAREKNLAAAPWLPGEQIALLWDDPRRPPPPEFDPKAQLGRTT